MPLFNTPTDKEGFYTPDAGTFILELTSIEEGPELQYGPTIKWVWAVFSMPDGQPVLYEGNPAKTDALSSHKMGPRAKARKWTEAHLGRVLIEGEDADALAQEIIGKRVMGMFAPNEKGDIRLQQVTRYIAG